VGTRSARHPLNVAVCVCVSRYRAINTFVEFEVDFESTYGQWDGSYEDMNTGFPNATTMQVCARSV
jgi:hypothetical protein